MGVGCDQLSIYCQLWARLICAQPQPTRSFVFTGRSGTESHPQGPAHTQRTALSAKRTASMSACFSGRTAAAASASVQGCNARATGVQRSELGIAANPSLRRPPRASPACPTLRVRIGAPKQGHGGGPGFGAQRGETPQVGLAGSTTPGPAGPPCDHLWSWSPF
jgi:hypothetical protein